MAYTVRSLLCNKIGQVVYNSFNIGGKSSKPSSFLQYLKLSIKPTQNIEYELNLEHLVHNSIIPVKEQHSLRDWVTGFIENFQTDSSISGVYYYSTKKYPILKFIVNNEAFMKETLDLVLNRPLDFWKSSTLLPNDSLNIVVDFSSPNIAKPFHIGHLRSTLVGNFICNIHEALGHKVTRLNYLGDWGVQFGILKYGLMIKNVSEAAYLKHDPLNQLCSLYVWINEEASKNPEIYEKAKALFAQMENNDEEILDAWKLIREISLEELNKSYKRLNVSFNEYHGESMYRLKKCQSILSEMEKKGLIKELDGRKLYQLKERENITLMKNDGMPLYITRDIAAAIERFNKFKFDKMYYVVDSSQQKHFGALFKILKDLGYSWSDQLSHISFGRILHMSTRKGTAMFLSDILDNAKEEMSAMQTFDKDTRVTGENAESSADVIGVSALIVAILRASRNKNVDFNWKAAIKAKGDTGHKLQYTHCRLSSLEEMFSSEFSNDNNWNSSLLSEPEAVDLVRQIARFDEVIDEAFKNLESSNLVIYLFNLCKAINRAWKALPVKNTSTREVSTARFKLFQASRLVLAAGFNILGLAPQIKM